MKNYLFLVFILISSVVFSQHLKGGTNFISSCKGDYVLNKQIIHGNQILRSSATTSKFAFRPEARYFVYPNPFNTTFTLALKNTSLQYDKVTLKNIYGQIIFEVAIHTLLEEEVSFEGGEWPVGLYFLELSKNGTLLEELRILKN
jgi:Secretion system C-terminal sorting domain